MFTKRLVSGIILVILAIIVVGKGGALLYGVTALISLIGLFELYRVLKIEKNAMGIVGYLTAVSYYGLVWFDGHHYVTLMAIAALMVMMAIYVFTFPKYRTEEVAESFFGVFYVAVMLSFILLTRNLENGHLLVWLIFFCSWGCDTFAYCAGKLFGKHKMTPKLSPKKTVEGAIGGVVGAAVLGFLYGTFFKNNMIQVINPGVISGAACAIAAVISMVGDLAASAIKRNHDIKDYGNLIPGHGGILDRFDSMIFTAPAIYFAITFMGIR